MKTPQTPDIHTDTADLLVRRMGHDFNNLFNVILGGLSLLREDIPDAAWNAEAKEIYDDILSATQEATSVVAQLTAWAAKQSTEPQATDINNTILQCGKLLRRALPETIELEIVPTTKPAIAWVDRSLLLNALLELATNAQNAMPHGGKIVIAIDANSPTDIRVTDNGIGMNELTLAQCKQPYFTSNSVGNRRGLGLSVVDGFARASNGHLSINSQVEYGTCVTLHLHAAQK